MNIVAAFTIKKYSQLSRKCSFYCEVVLDHAGHGTSLAGYLVSLVSRKRKPLPMKDSCFFWLDLEAGDEARSSVNLRAYGQREPLVEFKKESARLFREMDVVRKQEFLDKISKLEISEPITPVIEIRLGETMDLSENSEIVNLDQKQEHEKRVINNPITERIPVIDKNRKYARVKKGHSIKDVKTKQLGEYLAAGWEVSDIG